MGCRRVRRFSIRLYGQYDKYRQIFKEMGLTFTERDILSNFFGKEFVVDAPKGKGSVAKCKQLLDLGMICSRGIS